MAKIKEKDLADLRALIESGAVVPVIDRTYLLPEVPDAFEYLGKKHAKGKVVIEIQNG